ncbi:hypothetical protein F8M41_010486 [Gigaspora margarita]|uniref:Uncharacterized protein n=1 Tax=Gigaspora margarita TaxID=4874 RepID=A0A8H4A395_GIGMA|nr:hypothetical protein F8M41_010486 [Gigaspora margarita]
MNVTYLSGERKKTEGAYLSGERKKMEDSDEKDRRKPLNANKFDESLADSNESMKTGPHDPMGLDVNEDEDTGVECVVDEGNERKSFIYHQTSVDMGDDEAFVAGHCYQKEFEWKSKCTGVRDCNVKNTDGINNVGCYYH